MRDYLMVTSIYDSFLEEIKSKFKTGKCQFCLRNRSVQL